MRFGGPSTVHGRRFRITHRRIYACIKYNGVCTYTAPYCCSDGEYYGDDRSAAVLSGQKSGIARFNERRIARGRRKNGNAASRPLETGGRRRARKIEMAIKDQSNDMNHTGN